MKKYVLECSSFLAGALGMIIELVAARILSPYLGSSQLIWTCIIGMMLAFMSLGYFIGGKLADKKPIQKIMSLFMLMAAVFISLIPLIEAVVIEPFSELSNKIDPIIIAILCSTLTFGPSSMFLATISPFAVKLKEKNNNNIGQVSGRMSALSTIGSIIGTFTAGFLLIPHIGVKNIILITSVIAFLVSFILYDEKNLRYIISSIITLFILVIIIYYGKYTFNKNHPEIIIDTDSEYSRIWIRKYQSLNEDRFFYTLEAEKGYESVATEDGELYAEYMQYYNLFDYFKPDTENVLMIGGAAYVYPTYFLNHYENKNIDVVEIDPKMTALAEEYFNLDKSNPHLKIYHQDGRTYLNNSKNKYDCILVDAFKGINAPFHLATYEALVNAKKCLNDDGIIITNIVSSLEGKNSAILQHEYATYKKVFNEVKLYKVQNGYFKDDQIQNLVIVGFNNPNIQTNELNKEIQDMLNNEVKDYKSSKPVVTDDYCPIGV